MSLLQIQLPPEIPVEDARLLLAIKLFETGRLTIGQAAKMAGYTKSTFIELTSRQGVPIVDYPAEELAQEVGL